MGLAEAYPRGEPTSLLVSERFSTLSIHGRPLVVDRAVDREKAKSFKERNKKEFDKRNTYLLEEGLVKEGEPNAVGVSKADLDKRRAGYKERKAKLKNPNFFVS